MGGSDEARLRARIVGAIAFGTALSACGDRRIEVAGGSETGTGTEGTTSGDDAWATETSSGAETTTSTSDDGDELRWDVQIAPDVSGWPQNDCIDHESLYGWTCPDTMGEPLAWGCVGLPTDGGCELLSEEVVLDAINDCLVDTCTAVWEIRCGPDPTVDDLCCFWFAEGQSCPGRPWIVEGRARLAPLRPRADWGSRPATHERPDARTRRAVARAWGEMGRFEHAAVASFSRFALQLLAIGAPAELVAQAVSAADDERRHAQAFFGLASAFAGRPLGPGPLDVRGGLGSRVDLVEVAVSTATEACIAETVSLAQLRAARRLARDPGVIEILDAIVGEELRHVELGWAFLGWALAVDRSSTLRAALAGTFAAPSRALPLGPPLDRRIDPKVLARFGLLDAPSRGRVAEATLLGIVGPCARALLTGPAPAPAATPRRSADR